MKGVTGEWIMAEWSKEKIIDKIKKLDDKTDRYVRKNNKTLYSAARRYFGSWEKTIEAAGFNYDKVRLVQEWSKNKIIKEIKKLSNKTSKWVKKIIHYCIWLLLNILNLGRML